MGVDHQSVVFTGIKATFITVIATACLAIVFLLLEKMAEDFGVSLLEVTGMAVGAIVGLIAFVYASGLFIVYGWPRVKQWF